MELHEKLVQIRKDKKLKICQLHNKIQEVFGKKAISYRTLLRVENAHTSGRDSSLYQMCLALGTTVRDVKKSVADTTPSIVNYVAKKNRDSHFIYNEKVFSDVVTAPQRKMYASEMVLLPKGETRIEQDSNEKGEKLVYILRGKLECSIADKKITVKKDDCLSLDSAQPHSFRNPTTRKTRCLIVQHPNSAK